MGFVFGAGGALEDWAKAWRKLLEEDGDLAPAHLEALSGCCV